MPQRNAGPAGMLSDLLALLPHLMSLLLEGVGVSALLPHLMPPLSGLGGRAALALRALEGALDELLFALLADLGAGATRACRIRRGCAG